MFLADKYIIRRNLREREEGRDEGREEGRDEVYAALEAWERRRDAAAADGEEFTEPLPSRNKPDKAAKRKQAASAF